LIFDDVSQGVAVYKLSTTDRVKTFDVPFTTRRIRQVAFHDGNKAIVTGSDHGSVYIFDRRTGDVIDTIKVGIKDWVQSIAVRSTVNKVVNASR
jgi:WD40 repeat protein